MDCMKVEQRVPYMKHKANLRSLKYYIHFSIKGVALSTVALVAFLRGWGAMCIYQGHQGSF